jgi:hypothetical protein
MSRGFKEHNCYSVAVVGIVGRTAFIIRNK